MYLVDQPYWVPHGILRIFDSMLYKNKFQNPQILRRTHGPLPSNWWIFLFLSMSMSVQ
jgi:hypothetical protein